VSGREYLRFCAGRESTVKINGIVYTLIHIQSRVAGVSLTWWDYGDGSE